MRSTSTISLLVTFFMLLLSVVAQVPSPSASSRPSCSVICPYSDNNGSELDYSSLNDGQTECTYLAGNTCVYDSTGALSQDTYDGGCPSSATRTCASRRFNMVAALAERRRAAAARPRSSEQDVTKLRRRANLARLRY
jgi:hypothetical protein